MMSANAFFTAAAAGSQAASNSLGQIIAGGFGTKKLSELMLKNNL
jgi:hypothetical protein